MMATGMRHLLNRRTSTYQPASVGKITHVAPVLRSTTSPSSPHRPVIRHLKGSSQPASLYDGAGALDSDQQALQASAGVQRTLSFVAFWLQLALSISAAGVLLFSVGFTAPSARLPTGPAMDLSKVLSLAGIALAFVSSFFAHGFLNLAHKLQAGQSVSRAWITRSLITNNTLNLAGIMATAVALQASVGTLVAKSLMGSALGSQPYPSAYPSTLVSIDVFGLQASTNSLLCHIVSLVFTNMMLRILTPKAPDTPLHTSTPPPPMYTQGASAPPYSSPGYSSSGYAPTSYSSPPDYSSSGYSPSAYPPPPTYNSPPQPPLRG